MTQAFGQPSEIRPSLLSYSNIGENRQNTFLRFEDAGRNALTHGQIRWKDRGKLIVYQYLVQFLGLWGLLELVTSVPSFLWLQLCEACLPNGMCYNSENQHFVEIDFWRQNSFYSLSIRCGLVCGHKYIQVLPPPPPPELLYKLKGLSEQNLFDEEQKFFVNTRLVWSMTKSVIWLVGVNGSTSPGWSPQKSIQFVPEFAA